MTSDDEHYEEEYADENVDPQVIVQTPTNSKPSNPSPFTPLPPRRVRKLTTNKSDPSDVLMEKAISLIEKVNKRMENKPEDDVRSTGNFVTFTLSTMPKEERAKLIAETIKLYNQHKQ